MTIAETIIATSETMSATATMPAVMQWLHGVFELLEFNYF